MRYFKRGGVVLDNILVSIVYAPVVHIVCRNNIWRLYSSYHKSPTHLKKLVWNRYMVKHGASISIDAEFAEAPVLPHGVSGIFITQSAKIGKNAVIFQQVTIGANTLKGSKSYGAPTIGNDVYIGAGAKIIGNAVVGNGVRIGANAVIIKNIPDNSLVVSEHPRIIVREEKMDNTFRPFIEQS